MQNEKITVDINEFKNRLKEINWVRYKKHWINITGYAPNKEGGKQRFELKSESTDENNKVYKVKAAAPNLAAKITQVQNLILSHQWHILCADEDEPLNDEEV